MTGQRITHYQVLEKLGGGMGVVYRAEDLRLKRTVALKFLPPELTRDPEAKARFVREAQAASALDHPNICTIFEIDEAPVSTGAEEQTFIAMACYEGETLKQKIARGPLPVEEGVEMAVQIAQGLARAHEAAIVHRDIKPANVMVTSRGEVKILDFGLAKVAHETALTRTGSTMGTVAYMSPEQARGEAVDERTDIWSLGVMLYEMLTGQRPFEGVYDQAVLYAILNELPVPLQEHRPEVPEALARLMERMLAKKPDARPQRMQEVVQTLRALGEEAPVLPEAVPAGGPAAGDRRRWVVGAAVLAVLLLGALLVFTQLGPASSEVSPPARTAIAVLPFSVQGSDDLAYLSEGMVDLLSTKLDGIAGLRSVDPNALLSYIEDADGVRDPAQGRQVAAHFGAGRYILGRVLRFGGQIQLKASPAGGRSRLDVAKRHPPFPLRPDQLSARRTRRSPDVRTAADGSAGGAR